MRSRYKIYNEDGIFFVTSTIIEWLPVFTNEKYYGIMVETVKHYQQNGNLTVYAYVFMDNHFHMIISDTDISMVMQSLKKYTAKEIIRNLTLDSNETVLRRFRECKPAYKTTSKHQVWQESFHPQEIISCEMLKQKIEYIHNNPVRRQYVARPEEWKYSSAVDYLTEKKGLLEIVRLV